MFAVDIPDSCDPEGDWINLGFFDTRDEAIAYAHEALGADKDGRIGLVSEIDDENDVDPEYADVDEDGQFALGVAGEQRAIPGLAKPRTYEQEG